MRVRSEKRAGVQLLGFELGGVLDCYVADDFKTQALHLLDPNCDVVVDLSPLEFVDSTGLGTLVGLYRRVRGRGRQIVLAGARPYVSRVMRVIKLDRVFDLYDAVEDAVDALSAAPAGAGTRRP
jgi:anti-sigma B factor antagonist